MTPERIARIRTSKLRLETTFKQFEANPSAINYTNLKGKMLEFQFLNKGLQNDQN